jgi:hypothetical protein
MGGRLPLSLLLMPLMSRQNISGHIAKNCTKGAPNRKGCDDPPTRQLGIATINCNRADGSE